MRQNIISNTHQINYAVALQNNRNNFFEENNSSKKEKYFNQLHIKNMVSITSIIVVKDALEKLGINYSNVELGLAVIQGDISISKREELKTILLKYGLDLLDNKKDILVEKIKNVVVEIVHYADELPKVNYSDYIGDKLKHNYTYLSNIFSEETGTNIKDYIIAHKIEKVKELLMYNELSTSEIAYKLNYSSVSHLSNQFKKVTGMSPRVFKKIKNRERVALENL